MLHDHKIVINKGSGCVALLVFCVKPLDKYDHVDSVSEQRNPLKNCIKLPYLVQVFFTCLKVDYCQLFVVSLRLVVWSLLKWTHCYLIQSQFLINYSSTEVGSVLYNMANFFFFNCFIVWLSNSLYNFQCLIVLYLCYSHFLTSFFFKKCKKYGKVIPTVLLWESEHCSVKSFARYYYNCLEPCLISPFKFVYYR